MVSARIKEPSLTRRDFLYTLGGMGGSIVLGGWVTGAIIPFTGSPALASTDETGAVPCLRPDLIIMPTDAGALIFDPALGKSAGPRCMVNRIGLKVIRRLNGSRPVEAIAEDLLDELDRPPGEMESFAAGVARFTANLSSVGLLVAPFFVNIYSREFSA